MPAGVSEREKEREREKEKEKEGERRGVGGWGLIARWVPSEEVRDNSLRIVPCVEARAV